MTDGMHIVKWTEHPAGTKWVPGLGMPKWKYAVTTRDGDILLACFQTRERAEEWLAFRQAAAEMGEEE